MEKTKESILKEGGRLPQNILREFLTRGASIVWRDPNYVPDPSLPFWGEEESIFQVGDFRFLLNFEVDDEWIRVAPPFLSSDGAISDPEVISILTHIAGFVSNPRRNLKKGFLKLLGLQEKPQDEVLFRKTVPVSGYKGPATSVNLWEERKVTNFEPVDKTIEELRREIESKLQNIDTTPKQLKYEFQDLIQVEYESKVEVKLEIVEDIEEGTGYRDNTLWSTKYVLAEIVQKWESKISISDEVEEEIKSKIINIINERR